MQIQAMAGASKSGQGSRLEDQKPVLALGRSGQQGIYLGSEGPGDGSGLGSGREAGQFPADDSEPVLCRHETHSPPMHFKTLT